MKKLVALTAIIALGLALCSGCKKEGGEGKVKIKNVPAEPESPSKTNTEPRPKAEEGAEDAGG